MAVFVAVAFAPWVPLRETERDAAALWSALGACSLAEHLNCAREV